MHHTNPYALKLWLESEPLLTEYAVNLSATPVQVYPANPARFAITITPSNAGNVWYLFTEQPMTATQGQWYVSSTTPLYIVHREQIGGLICLPLWVRASGGNPQFIFNEMAYNAQRWAKLQELYRDITSHPTAS